MIIYLDSIQMEGTRFQGVDPPDTLAVTTGIEVRIESPLRYDIVARHIGARLLVTGQLDAVIEMACSRCTCPVRMAVQEPAYCYDKELDKEIEYIDLTVDMQEAMVVLFPSYPVCHAECKGLCPQCGTNLNEGTCVCEPPDRDSRWSLLEGWH